MEMASEKGSFNLDSPEEVLDLAISAEMDAQQFYLQAADQVKDGKARATFLALAGDEEEHRLQLENQYRHLYKTGSFRYRSGTNILHRHLKKEVEDLEAISLAISAEKSAISFYREAGERAKDPEMRRILKNLQEFEEGHRRLLESEYQARLGRPWDDLELSLWVRE
jgi:rubrerythrin